MRPGDQDRYASPSDPGHGLGVRRWWRHAVTQGIDHADVVARITDESGWSPRFAFMTLMSAGIAVLGLLLSSPAVVIGAMLISPLMNPILGFGFSLATFDFAETRRSLLALMAGAALAIAFTALIVLLSPLKETTAEILSRTRPNLFDLLVALFAALAGTFAIIKGQGATIVGVAIATALMPPLAVIGYGLATWNLPVLGGALALFVTNFVTIALSATIMARLYGFGHSLSGHQGWIQTGMLSGVFVALAIPLGMSLSHIAAEAVTVTKVRAFLEEQFGAQARITQLAVDFDVKPLAVHAVVIVPRAKSKDGSVLRAGLSKKLMTALTLQVDEVLLGSATNDLEAQRAQLQATDEAAAIAKTDSDRVAKMVAQAAGVAPDSVIVDADTQTAQANAVDLPGANLETYRAMEQRAAASAPTWKIAIVPPLQPLPAVRFANGSDAIDDTARQAIMTAAWAARRWNSPRLSVPGLPSAAITPEKHRLLAQRRALAISQILSEQGIESVPAPADGQAVRLSLASVP